ncbi:MAG: DUF368 domain-containing protein [Clostridia bacterium]|nr:DUF368 domain-containing protein [Clostridia bacterium]
MELSYKSFKDILISVVVGFFIGLSVIVPGISGSSIAIILKVYDKMMFAFSHIFKKFKLCVIFLLPILFGIVLGFGLGLLLVKFLLEKFAFISICFFVGLMVGTYPLLFKEIKGEKITPKKSILFICGLIIPLVITVISLVISVDNTLIDVSIGHYLLFLIIGILISLTQLIPGLSATVLLMIFGYYTVLMGSIGIELFSNFKLLLVYVVLVVGFVIGTLLFSKIINKLLNTAKTSFFFVICGLSVSSAISVFIGNDCMDIYRTWTRNNMLKDILFGILLLIIGFALSFAFYIYTTKKEQKQSETNEEIKNI